MTQEMTQLYAALNAESSYMEPEVLRAKPATIGAFVNEEPRLEVYRHELHDILRRAAHTLSDAEEKLLADVGPLATAPSSIYSILSNADFPYPAVTLSDGTHGEDQSAELHRAQSCAPNRADRQAVHVGVTSHLLASYRRTFGTMMDGRSRRSCSFRRRGITVPRWSTPSIRTMCRCRSTTA